MLLTFHCYVEKMALSFIEGEDVGQSRSPGVLVPGVGQSLSALQAFLILLRWNLLSQAELPSDPKRKEQNTLQ